MATHNARRKKTRAQISRARVHAQQTKTKKVADDKEKMSWDNLAKLFQQCLDMYLPIHNLTPALTSPIFKEKATQEQCREIMVAVTQMTGHIQETLAELHDIRKKHFGRTGVVKGEKRTMEAIQIGMEYQSWVTKFNAAVAAPAMEISGRIEEILMPAPVEQASPVESNNEPLFADIDVTATETQPVTEEVPNGN